MNHSRPQLFGMLAGLFLAAGLVLSSMWEGVNDTTSHGKTVTAVVTATILLK